MELLVSGLDYRDESEGQFHDASEHGLAWAALNELLHVIVFVFTLFGMINFQVKFIEGIRLVKSIPKFIIAFNWYLSFKFLVMACVIYFYNFKLEQANIDMTSLNCTLGSYTHLPQSLARNGSMTKRPDPNDGMLIALFKSMFHVNYLAHLTWAVDTFGGPYRLLGNRATLIYGVYSISIYIMLAIFPLELMYFLRVGFNFIRFVLSDPNCMKDLYDKRKKHLGRLASWSRNQTDSLLTRAAKMIVNQRDLRSTYTTNAANYGGQPGLAAAGRMDFFVHTRQQLPRADLDLELNLMEEGASPMFESLESPPYLKHPSWLDDHDDNLSSGRELEEAAPTAAATSSPPPLGVVGNNRLGRFKAIASVKQPRTRCAVNHRDRPSYQVVIANRNLRRFKPFVRSDEWFKASMIIYPIFIFFYFMTHIIALAMIQLYLDKELGKVLDACRNLLTGTAAAAGHESSRGNLAVSEITTDWHFDRWSPLDWLCYYEHIYTVLVLSCASSFYCSYYFSTILELSVWLREISQQLILSTRVIELTDLLIHSATAGELSSFEARQLLSDQAQSHWIDFYVNDFGGFKEIAPRRKARQALEKQRQQHSRHLTRFEYKELSGCKLRELMAIRLLTKKATLSRATYVNMCLFFDELRETRFMTTTILRRTTQIAAGFAFMASITHSQFKANYWNLNCLLLSTFVIFNVYMACAAFVNSHVNKMLVQIHSLISASLHTGSEDVDLLEFWLRHVGSFGQDKDVTAYNIYGYKVTWSAIINIDSVMLTVYFMTT